MDSKEVSVSCVSLAEEKDVGVYPIYFGVSCAFVALHLFMERTSNLVDRNWQDIADKMLQGSAQLLGLLVWKAQGGEAIEGRTELLSQLKKAEMEVSELRRRRTEDGKANEKVLGIFASHEQSWICERKRLRLQIQALLNELRLVKTKSEHVISNLNEKAKEKEHLIQTKDKALGEDERKRKELEDKLGVAEAVVEELRESMKKEAQEHSSELWKHKTAYIELVSNQRQLEAEMGRALRELEATKHELDLVFEQKEDSVMMVQKLSVEIVKLRKDTEQKDKILSAMLRKSKLDTSERQILLKELKTSKTRVKQAELEKEIWRTHEIRTDRHSRGNLISKVKLEKSAEMKGFESTGAGSSQNCNGINPKALLLEYLEANHRKEPEFHTLKRMDKTNANGFTKYSSEQNRDIVITTDIKQLEDWVHMETEKYTFIMEQRHSEEIDAFADQLRLKNEQLEAFSWRLLSMELESKRLQSYIEGLDKNLSQFRDDNMKLEALLLDKETELKSLKEKFTLHSQICRKSHQSNYGAKSHSLNPLALWSEVGIMKKKAIQKDQEEKFTIENERKDKEMVSSDNMRNQTANPLPPYDHLNSLTRVGGFDEELEEHKTPQSPSENNSHDMSLTERAPEEESEEEKEVIVGSSDVQEEYVKNSSQQVVEVDDKTTSVGNCFIKKDSPWKTNIHALGVSYKIKRLKQQLLMLEKLAGTLVPKKPTSNEDASHGSGSCDKRNTAEQHGQQIKGFLLMISLLNKQVKRYQSLEEKTDDLCKRMQEKGREGSSIDLSIGRTKKETDTLQHFLEETFQLQRYMVATGQKLTEIQSRIAGNFVGGFEEIEECGGFDMKQLSNNLKALFREIQRGLEVRIARVIGDLEGTLTCEGILHFRN